MVNLEDLVRAISGELRREPGCLLASGLAVVLAAHPVGPTISGGPSQAHAVLGENGCVRVLVDRAGVTQRGSDLVTERALEPAGGEVLAAVLPVRQWPLGRGQDVAALVGHQLIVELMQTVLPRGVPLQGPTREVVVVDDVDVIVEVAADRVGVRHHQVVGGVHALRQPHTQLVDPPDVLGVIDVELVRGEVLGVAVELYPPTVGPRHRLSSAHERLRRFESARQRGGPVRPLLLVLRAQPLVVAVEGVPDRARRGPGGLHVDRAHRIVVRSPSSPRTSSTASMTACRRSSSAAAPRRSA